MTDHNREPRHSQTAVVLDELQLFGYRPFEDEPDPRPLPEADRLEGALADIFDALVATLSDTRLEPDLDDLLWSTTNLFHRMAARVDRQLDDNEQAQKRSQREQDGSEVRSVELERLIAEGITLVERRNAYELMRDSRRRALRDAPRPDLASARGLAGQPPHHDRGDDRQPRLPRRQAPGRDRAAAASRVRRSPSPAAPTSTTTTRSGQRSTRCTPSTRTWCSSMAARRRAPSGSPPAGPTPASARRSSSSRTGRATARPRRSSATTGCSRSCRSGSSSSRAPASPTTSPTRRRSSASRSSTSAPRSRRPVKPVETPPHPRYRAGAFRRRSDSRCLPAPGGGARLPVRPLMSRRQRSLGRCRAPLAVRRTLRTSRAAATVQCIFAAFLRTRATLIVGQFRDRRRGPDARRLRSPCLQVPVSAAEATSERRKRRCACRGPPACRACDPAPSGAVGACPTAAEGSGRLFDDSQRHRGLSSGATRPDGRRRSPALTPASPGLAASTSLDVVPVFADDAAGPAGPDVWPSASFESSAPAPVTASPGLIWPGPADASTASAATAGPDFLPLGQRPFLARQQRPAPPSSASLRARAAASAVAPASPIAIEAATVAGSRAKRRTDMATIGTFKKSGSEYVGEIVTLSVQAKNVRIVPEETAGRRQRPQPPRLRRPRRDRRRLVEALERGPRLPEPQARRSELHRSDLRQPLRRHRRRGRGGYSPHLVARPPAERRLSRDRAPARTPGRGFGVECLRADLETAPLIVGDRSRQAAGRTVERGNAMDARAVPQPLRRGRLRPLHRAWSHPTPDRYARPAQAPHQSRHRCGHGWRPDGSGVRRHPNRAGRIPDGPRHEMNSRLLVCRERSIVRGDAQGRIMTSASSRPGRGGAARGPVLLGE